MQNSPDSYRSNVSKNSVQRMLAIARIMGFFATGFSLTMVFPILVSYWYGDAQAEHFIRAMLYSFSLGITLLLAGWRCCYSLSVRDGFLVVALFWIGISFLAALPFVLGAHLSYTDAIFEAISGFTTTGATVITNLESLPRSILFYRQQLQWFGGMGMIVLAVAVLPLLGIGGMQLYRAEAPGPMKEDKLTPRLTRTAQLLWLIYIGITVVNAFAYWLAGMQPFDAIAHSLSTVSTGGFSTHDSSLGYFDSPLIEMIAMVFMLLGAINFSVHFLVWRNRSLLYYFYDIEVRVFLLITVFTVVIIGIVLNTSGEYSSLPYSIKDASFEVISVITSTGYGTVDFSHWPDFLPVLLILISFIGGCGGSTAGGMKVMRVLVLIQIAWREVKRLIHPRAVFSVRVGGRTLEPRIIDAVWGFLTIYVTTFVILMLLMMHSGLDQVSAFSAIATSMNNLGPGLGEVATTFATVSDDGKIIASIAMLLGRLEVFTLLVLLTPAFWKP